MIIRFGKYAGEDVEELPSDYLSWLVETAANERANAEWKFPDGMLECAEKEIARRDHDGDHELYDRDNTNG